ncbi:MAG TPA: transposase [Bryobacteraceae bacterium]|nr:transposase [Bryobacteraceae bacterium]
MARISRLVLENVAHHVVARGVGHMRLFRNGFDKHKYLTRFAQLAEEENVLVHAYCLMDNHVHLILTPSDPNGLARLFRRMHTWWAMKLNRWLERCGHVFQNRFHSSPLDENHYWTALRYVEVNPRRAGLVEHLESWELSSAKAHLAGAPDPLVPLAEEIGRRRFTAAQWREFLERTDAEKERELRSALKGSRPCGAPEWIATLEERFKRKLSSSPRARPAGIRLSPATA